MQQQQLQHLMSNSCLMIERTAEIMESDGSRRWWVENRGQEGW